MWSPQVRMACNHATNLDAKYIRLSQVRMSSVTPIQNILTSLSILSIVTRLELFTSLFAKSVVNY